MSTGDSETMLNWRQINVQRENLSSMCRISVKSLLDYACLYTHVNDDSEEFINFCAVFEQLVSHRLRAHQKKAWLPGQGTPRHFWDVLLDNYNMTRGILFQTCIPNIEAIESIRSPKAKLRAFIRVALMEKRLADYLYWLLDNTKLIHESYLEGAILTSEEASVLCGELIGLNAIDFNFCLKGDENELLGPLEISYSPFLSFKQNSASRCSDEIEMLQLSGKDIKSFDSSLIAVHSSEGLHFHDLEKDMRQIKEQKDYLEELLRLRDRQLLQANIRIENITEEWHLAERNRETDRSTMEACILELQKDIAKLQKFNSDLKAQIAHIKQFKQTERREESIIEVALDAGREVNHSEAHFEVEHGTRSSINRRSFKKEPSKNKNATKQRGIKSSSSLDKQEQTIQEIVSGNLINLQTETVAFSDHLVDSSKQETSQSEPTEHVLLSQKKVYVMKNNHSESDHNHIIALRKSSEEENQINNSERSMIMMDSYVVAQEVDTADSMLSKHPENSACAAISANENTIVGSFQAARTKNNIPALSDGSNSNENEVVSEPEMVIVSSSNDSTEAAWEVLPTLNRRWEEL